MNKKRIISAVCAGCIGLSSLTVPTGYLRVNAATANNTAFNNTAAMTVEYLDRGICAVNTGSGMLVSWRFLATDPDSAVFKLYRDNTLIYTSTEKANGATCFLDTGGNANSSYKVETYNGTQLISSDNCAIKSGNAYFDIKLDQPAKGSDGGTYSPNDMSVGDVDGDGVYELFVKWDPSTSKDNSQKGKTDKVYIDCYTLTGKKLWRIDLGVNIRAGAHYTQFYVADFDLDGKCEMTCKTSDGTVDGTGKVIGDKSKVYRDGNGLIYSGNEFYTLFDGATGAALDTVNYEPGRGDPTKWGKSSDKFNRVERYWGSVAYLDGIKPSVITGRGYYGRLTATAYSVENKKLKKLWTFDTGTSSSTAGYGDGNHNSMVADVDNDGKHEIITGSTCIDHDGKLKWNTNTGHGDALHVGDLDPTNPGIEVWTCHEDKPYGVSLIDADTGKTIFRNNGSGDTGRCCADNVWAGNPGAELWGNGNEVKGVNNTTLNCRRPAINFLSYWDGDLEREILDGYTDSPATISKLTGDAGKTTITNLLSTDGYYTCNTTKGTPCLSADIFGDWREELIVRKANGTGIRIYTTTYDTDYRVQCLMHDPQYRVQVSSQNTAYNQPPHTSFFLGTGYDMPARPACTVLGGGSTPIGKTGAVIDTANTYFIQNVNSGLNLEVADGKAEDGANVQQGDSVADHWTFSDAGNGYYYIYSTLGDGKTYLLDVDYGKTENGTNIGIWSNTNSDAQLFKLVDNGDGTYTIVTKASGDASALGIASGSKDNGANVVEWECNDSADQKWKLNIYVAPLQGKLIKDLVVSADANYQSWKIDDAAAAGDLVFGDRDVVFVSLPEAVDHAEMILTACDAKNCTEDQATFTAATDAVVYVAIDTRVTSIPTWLSAYEKTDMTAANDKDVSFVLYKKEIKSGESITLGTNGQSSGCVNYTVFITPSESTATIKGDVNMDGRFDVADVVLLQKWLLAVPNTHLADWKAADLCADDRLDVFDLCLMKRELLNSI